MVGHVVQQSGESVLHLPLFPDRKAFEEFAKAHPVTLFSAGTGQKGRLFFRPQMMLMRFDGVGPVRSMGCVGQRAR